ncbi:UNVERIFIED_CONTAM: uncharacterized protein (DUF305 family) [Williamsia faeni]
MTTSDDTPDGASDRDKTAQDETVQNETDRDETAQDEPEQDEAPRGETDQDESERDDSDQDEIPQDKTDQDASDRNESGQDETVQDDTGRADPTRVDSANDAADRDAPRGRRSQQTAVLVLGAIAVLLIGVVVGLLLRMTFDGDDDSNKPAADSAAVGFSQDMIRHHQQAVEMATLELYGGSDPQVRSLAYDILTSQVNQIGQMQSWLARWDYPIDNPGEPMAWMTDHGSGHHHDGSDHAGSTEPSMDMDMSASGVPMPGMATTEEMNQLRSLQGSELDLYFLQLMLRHHQGGIEMMEYAVEPDHVSEDYVRNLAQQMINVQESESETMTKMIESRGAAPLPMN